MTDKHSPPSLLFLIPKIQENHLFVAYFILGQGLGLEIFGKGKLRLDSIIAGQTALIIKKTYNVLFLQEKLKRDVDTAFLNETGIIEQQPWKKIK